MSIPAVTKAYFASIFPELASTPEAVVDALNPIGLNYVGEAIFGSSDTAQYALALAIAYMVTLGGTKGGGPVTMDKIGELSTSYAAMSTDESMKMNTYGLRLLELGKMLTGGGFFVGGDPSGVNQQPFSGYQPTWTGPGRPFPPFL